MQASGIAVSGRGVNPNRRSGSAPSQAKIWGVLALGSAPAIVVGIMAARGGLSNPWVLPLAIIAMAANVFIVASDLRYGLALFIMAAGISPKLPGVYNNLRVEDFVFVLVFGIWVTRRIQGGRFPRIRSATVGPFLAITLISILASFWGSYLGSVPDVKYSFFLQAKRIEYFLIFYVVATTIRTEGWLRSLVVIFVASAAVAAAYGIANPSSAYGQSVAETRVSGPEGENYNTLAGYLVVCISAGIATIPGFPRGRTKLFVIACTAMATAAVLMSFSREGYIMLVGAIGTLAFTKQRKLFFVAILGLAAVFFAAEPVRENVSHTITQIQNAKDDDPGSNSLTARFRSWEYRWNGWFVKQPLFGNGVGSVALSVDNEYLLRACEVGIVGFGIFVWWLASIGLEVRRLQRYPGLPQQISAGLGAAFVGLLIQGSVAASFTSIRTMEPFWFLLGLAAVANQLRQEQLSKEKFSACVS